MTIHPRPDPFVQCSGGSLSGETWLSLRVRDASCPQDAVRMLRDVYLRALEQRGLDEHSEILVRIFCSDVHNHAPLFEELWPENAASLRVYIGQEPLDSAYCSVQAYHMDAGSIRKHPAGPGALLVEHGGYSTLHHLACPAEAADSFTQSGQVMSRMLEALQRQGMNLRDHVLRTWYYVRDVDNNYAGMVRSRKECYEARGLTPQTRFIASTGIEACAVQPHALVWLQTLAMQGLRPEQIRYLKALSHLSPTALYGVNFERATHVRFGDREHCLISGTASIDAQGRIVHDRHVEKQLQRTLENMKALLEEGGMTLEDMRRAIVYLRDGQEYHRIQDALAAALPQECAVNVVRGAVCRPGWLIEIEGLAAKGFTTSSYKPYYNIVGWF